MRGRAYRLSGQKTHVGLLLPGSDRNATTFFAEASVPLSGPSDSHVEPAAFEQEAEVGKGAVTWPAPVRAELQRATALHHRFLPGIAVVAVKIAVAMVDGAVPAPEGGIEGSEVMGTRGRAVRVVREPRCPLQYGEVQVPHDLNP